MRAGHRGIFDDRHRRFLGPEHDIAVRAGLGEFRRIRLAGVGFGELRRRNGSEGAGEDKACAGRKHLATGERQGKLLILKCL
jgi:hypothetical protein